MSARRRKSRGVRPYAGAKTRLARPGAAGPRTASGRTGSIARGTSISTVRKAVS